VTIFELWGECPLERSHAAGSNAANAATVERVLDTERNVEARVRKAIEEADFVVRSAWARGDTIRQRADERISRLHVAMEDRIETEIARLRKEFLEGEDGHVDELQLGVDHDALQRAVRRLAARMTGETDDGDR
jgi:vacuolar-type H+-ATPase subunit H